MNKFLLGIAFSCTSNQDNGTIKFKLIPLLLFLFVPFRPYTTQSICPFDRVYRCTNDVVSVFFFTEMTMASVVYII